jgi:hypothetical protein
VIQGLGFHGDGGGQEFLDRMAIALGGKALVPAAGKWFRVQG